MDVLITGIPVVEWHSLDKEGSNLKKSIRRALEHYLEHERLPYGDEVRVTFFGSYGRSSVIKVAFDCPTTLRPLCYMLVAVVENRCFGHSAENGHWLKDDMEIVLCK